MNIKNIHLISEQRNFAKSLSHKDLAKPLYACLGYFDNPLRFNLLYRFFPDFIHKFCTFWQIALKQKIWQEVIINLFLKLMQGLFRIFYSDFYPGLLLILLSILYNV